MAPVARITVLTQLRADCVQQHSQAFEQRLAAEPRMASAAAVPNGAGDQEQQQEVLLRVYQI